MLKWIKNLKIGVKSTLGLGIILLLSFGFLSVISYQSSSNALQENISLLMNARAIDGTKIIFYQMEKMKADVAGIAARPEIQSMDWETQNSVLQGEKKRLGSLKFGVADLDGKMQDTNGGVANLSDRIHFKKAKAGEAWISDPLVSKVDQQIITSVAVPIKKNHGEICGVLIASYDGTIFSDIVGQINVGDSKEGYGYLINKTGVIVAHPSKDLVLAQENQFEIFKANPELHQLEALVKKMVVGEQGSGRYTYKGIEKFLAYAPVPGTDWSLGLNVPSKIIFSRVKTLRDQLIVVTLISIIFSIVLLYIFIRYLVAKPVQNLVSAANQVANGDTDIDIKADSNDEMGILGKAFQNMVENIKAQSNIANRIAAGDLTVQVRPRSEKDLLAISMKRVVETLQELISETGLLTAAAVEGRLSTRGEAAKFEGGYQEVVEGINKILDAVIEPVKEASSVLQEIAEGNLQVSVSGSYQGDHAQIKEALNSTIGILQNYINEISAVVTEIANGNMVLEIDGDYRGDFAPIKKSLLLIINAFNEILSNLNTAAEQVAAGAGQVAQSSQALSQGSAEQAGTVEEITASITEIAAQTKQNANNANQANELAILAKDNAVGGNEQMKAMLKSMEEINESSSNISKIIKVIDEIAFQTNILALNAAVEAARAGQHGKGFAVVAEEVRNLAARSANAAKETTSMIEGSIKKVEMGTKIAKDTAFALDKIVEGVTRATEIVSEIAAASNEQATGITQINQGVVQVSQITQSNTATAEQGAAASEELSSQAQLLKSMVGRFKIKDIKNVTLNTDRKQRPEGIKKGAPVNSKIKKTKISLDDQDFAKY